MDWTSIITTLLTLLIPTGGLVTIFTMAEKKSALMLKNAKELAESYKALAEEYQHREASTQALAVQRDQDLISQIKMNSAMRRQLDDAHTEMAVAKLMYCKTSNCVKRDPPFGHNADAIVNSIKKSEYAANKKEER